MDLNPILEIISNAIVFPYFIFISGGTCSGKTFLAKILKDFYPQECEILQMDNYFKDKDDPTVPTMGGFLSFDLPNSYLKEEIKQDILKLAEGVEISSPVYSIGLNKRVGYQSIKSKKIIIVEGLYASQISGVIENPLQKINVFVSASLENMLKRRIERDLENFGISKEKTTERFYKLVEGPYRMYLVKQKADVRIENNFERNGEK